MSQAKKRGGNRKQDADLSGGAVMSPEKRKLALTTSQLAADLFGVNPAKRTKKPWTKQAVCKVFVVHHFGIVLVLKRGDTDIVDNILMTVKEFKTGRQQRFIPAKGNKLLLGWEVKMFWKYMGDGTHEQLVSMLKKKKQFNGWDFEGTDQPLPLQTIATEMQIFRFLTKHDEASAPYPNDETVLCGEGATCAAFMASSARLALDDVDSDDGI